MRPIPATLFQPYLLPGERIVWTGRPKQGVILRPADAFLIPFSLLWLGFALFWNIAVWTLPFEGEGPDPTFKLFGLPFLIIGIYAVIGRFFHDAAIRKKLAYSLTDQRVLIVKGNRSAKLTSLDLHRLPNLELNEHRDGTGTIIFEASGWSFFNPGHAAGMDLWVPSLGASLQFFRIDNPRKVYQLIRENSARS